MDPQVALVEAILRAAEDEVAKKREKTRLMRESLRVDRAAVEAKERERSMRMRENDQLLAVQEAGENLVAAFLEADGGNNNFDENAMMDAIVDWLGGDDGDGEDDRYGDDDGDGHDDGDGGSDA